MIGIYFYDGTVFDRIRGLKPSGRGEYEITDINNSYIDEGTLRHTILEGWWTDAGTFESLWHASNMVREKVLRSAAEPATVRRHEATGHGRRRIHRLQFRSSRAGEAS